MSRRIHFLPRRGFTLVELSIVMMVSGAILGGVWVVSQKVFNNLHQTRATQQTLQVVQNIREYYMNAQGMAAGCGDVTDVLDARNLFPPEMRRYCPSGACSGTYNFKIDNPYNNQETNYGGGPKAGSFRVVGTSCTGGVASKFRVILMDLPIEACAQLLYHGLAFKDQTYGITRVCGASEVSGSATTGAGPRYCYDEAVSGSNTHWPAVTCTNGLCDTSPAMTLSYAQSLCASAATSEVGWEFNVRN